MKTLLKKIIILLILIPFISLAQNAVEPNLSTTEIENMNQAVQIYWDWNTDEDPVKAIALLEQITTKNQDNWLAPYWASYIATQIANSSDKNTIEYLNKSQSFFDQANGRFSYLNKKEDKYTSSNFNALQSLILRLKGFYYNSNNDNKKGEDLLSKSLEQLNSGIKKSPNNPILMVLAAIEMATSKTNNGFGHIIAAIALLEKAKMEFKKINNRSASDITYWNEHWIDSWLNNLRPPNN